jgi:hypothetical protein
MVTKRTDSLTPQHGGVLTIKVEATAKLPLNRVPVSGFEPTARRLQEVRPCAPYALAATMARATALTDSLHWNYPTRRSTNRSTRTARQRSMAVSDRSARTDLMHGG